MSTGRSTAGTGAHVRVDLHVRPGAASNAVGGTHDGALCVRVSAVADKGRATEAALAAVARAVGVSRGQVTLVRGATARRKLVDIACGATPAGQVEERLAALRAGGPEQC